MQYTIQACCGQAIDVAAGQSITITDLEGQQVVDFFAEVQGNHNEFVSPGVTLDVNESLRLKTGDRIYSNLYRPMFLILHDDVCEHDLLHPCCRREMYDFFYHNGEGHPNCLENINHALETAHPILQPINLFMHTELHADGSLSVKAPVSKAGDRIVLRALMDVRLGIAACSVSESACNAGHCSAIGVTVE